MKQQRKIGLAVIGLLCTVMWMSFPILMDLAEARAGRGGSVGSRGSRSSAPPRQTYSPPPSQSQPAPTPMAPGQQRPGMGTPAQSPGMGTPAPSPGMGSFGRGLAGGLAGGLLGGMIGNMLFGGSGQAAGAGGAGAGGGCTSIGLFDILIIGGLLYLGYRMLGRRRQEAYEASSAGGGAVAMPASWQAPEPMAQPGYDLRAELDAIRRTDPSFDEAAFKEKAQDTFFKLQSAWMRQDASLLRDLATPELAAILERDLADFKAKGHINKLENIAVRQVEISEAWQEQGQEYITVGFLANLLDYTVDANTNLVVAGSDTEPVKFEEYWTFTRPIGGGPWKLTAITQPQG